MSRGVNVDVIVRQGADFFLLFQLFDELPVETITPGGVVMTPGVLTDLTGITFRSQFREKDTKGSVEANVTAAQFTVVQRDVDGSPQSFVQMHIPHAVTRAMSAPVGVYDVEAVDTAEDVVVEALYGKYTLALEATQETP